MCAHAYACVVIWTQAERRCEVVLGGVKGWRERGREGRRGRHPGCAREGGVG